MLPFTTGGKFSTTKSEEILKNNQMEKSMKSGEKFNETGWKVNEEFPVDQVNELGESINTYRRLLRAPVVWLEGMADCLWILVVNLFHTLDKVVNLFHTLDKVDIFILLIKWTFPANYSIHLGLS